MNTIVEEEFISFKEFEQKIFASVCKIGRLVTRTILEAYDEELAKSRDKKKYRNKGPRETTIKTIYGEVTYSRRVYQTVTETGKNAHVFLLDQAMGMEKIGLISTNLAEKIAFTVTEAPYRVAADVVTKTCGQSISAQGVWKLIQELGERIDEEEQQAVSRMKAEQEEGTRALPVLFEEMDGVWLHMQDKRHRKMKNQEMKVFTMYEGWDARDGGRSRLVGKTMLAGMEGSERFHEKREALIHQKYDADEIGQRILNGDGGGWIRDTYDPETIFQLDRYHIYQEILRKIKDKKAQQDIRRLFEEEDIEGMLEYIRIYATSVESPEGKNKESEQARELLKYLENNKEGLLPYDKRGIIIPEAPEGVVYKHMGVQENQNCTVITLRMKHRRMRWSPAGANNLSKALYRKENKDLADTIERCTDGLVRDMQMQEVVEVLSAAKAPKKDGKGDAYAEKINSHMPLKDAIRTASRKALLEAFA